MLTLIDSELKNQDCCFIKGSADLDLLSLTRATGNDDPGIQAGNSAQPAIGENLLCTQNSPLLSKAACIGTGVVGSRVCHGRSRKKDRAQPWEHWPGSHPRPSWGDYQCPSHRLGHSRRHMHCHSLSLMSLRAPCPGL